MRKTNGCLAWLALLAIGLSVVSPVISRTLASMAATAEPPCHMGMDALAQMPSTHRNDGNDHDHGSMLMEACGYCGLLGHSPMLIAVAWLPPPPVQPMPQLPALPAIRGKREHPTPTAAPRGPPPAFLYD